MFRYLTKMIGRELIVASACLMLMGGLAMATERAVDLELVLAADISQSMDLEEAALQRRGFALAVRSPQVIEAIQSGPLGRIAIAYVEWAGEHYQSMLVGWTEVSDEKSAAAFAQAIDRLTPKFEIWTSISAAITYAARSFEGNGFDAPRRIIDISGDGPNNKGAYVVDVRDRTVADGIVINGLPIVNDRPNPFGYPLLPNLDLYYEDCVIGGPGSFLIVANGFPDFARAIRTKMVLEIAGVVPPDSLLRLASETIRPPCDAGEQQLRGWMFDFQ